MLKVLSPVLGLVLSAPAAAAVDLAALWDFNQPAVSEQRFRDALAAAQGDDALILHTQIARTWGLRRDFTRAREILTSIEPGMAAAGPEARVRFALEQGRSWASATHPAEQRTPENQARAREWFERALAQARAAGLDALAIDAIHMFAFTDTAPADQLRWGQAALEVSLGSSQPAARRWEASIRHNIGFALHQLARYPEALVQFEQALALREAAGNAQSIHVGRWMVAWTLRAMGRLDEALALQTRLEREAQAAGRPDVHVFEELEHLYRALGDPARAAHYAQLREVKRP